MNKNEIVHNEIERIRDIIEVYQNMLMYLELQKEKNSEDVDVPITNTIPKKPLSSKKKKLMRPTANTIFNYLKERGSSVTVSELISFLKNNKIGNWEKEKYALNGLKRSLEGNDLFKLTEDAQEFENKKFGLKEWENVNVDEESAISSSTDGVPRE